MKPGVIILGSFWEFIIISAWECTPNFLWEALFNIQPFLLIEEIWELWETSENFVKTYENNVKIWKLMKTYEKAEKVLMKLIEERILIWKKLIATA